MARSARAHRRRRPPRRPPGSSRQQHAEAAAQRLLVLGEGSQLWCSQLASATSISTSEAKSRPLRFRPSGRAAAG
jgi:hypothetical protein